MKFRVFVDGQEGTTGLQIHERLNLRDDVEILSIDPEKRKDPAVRKELIDASDVTFLCLPDEAAKESAALCSNPKTRIIDASTAHRTNPDWVYGLPEISGEQYERIAKSRRIANPGCHATAFILGIYPLIRNGLVSASDAFASYSITGYSGGGKKLIAAYEADGAQCSAPGESPALFAPRPYALSLFHKHIPEMMKVCSLTNTPFFNPVLGPFYKGMAVTTALFPQQFSKKAAPEEIVRILSEHYAGRPFIQVMPYEANPVLDGGALNCTVCNDTNRARIYVFGNKDVMQVTAVIDNLGKGASGAAVQNMNIALGLAETTGLKGYL